MPTAARPKDALEAVFASAGKKGLNVGPLNSVISDQLWLPTGNIAIDNAFGGGIPMGRQLEFFGPTHCGKTTLVLQSCVALQKIILAGGDKSLGIKEDDVILYVDYEGTVDLRYAVALGFDPEHPSFRITQPDTLEEGADLIQKAVATGRVRLVVVDSVAAMVPSAQAEAESVGKMQVALAARLLKTFGQNLNPLLRNNNCTVLWINHESEVIGGFTRPGMSAPTTTPGGKALKYFATIRGQFRPIKHYKGSWTDPLTGEVKEIRAQSDIRLSIVKNKVGNAYRDAVLRVRFGRGFDPFWTAMQILLAEGKVVYGDGKFYFHNLADQGGAPDWMERMKSGTFRPYVSKGIDDRAIFKAADRHPEWRQLIIDIGNEIGIKNIALSDQKEIFADDDESDEAFEEEIAEINSLEELIDAPHAGKRIDF